MKMTAEQIVKQITELSKDSLVETNDGTHGLDPQFHTWKTWERLDGSRYTTGAKGDVGYVRHLKHESAAARRAQVEALQAQLKTARSAATQRANRIEELNRGWDGYQFIGIDKGRELASRM